MSKQKKVSIIIPCYNKGEYVEEAIKSALAQTYENLEIVIVNDASTDNSAINIKKAIEGKDNIIFFDEKINKGLPLTRNQAIDNCSGDYILPLDADDTIEPTYVEKAVKILDENPKVGIVYCKARLFGDENKEWILPRYSKKTFIFQNCIFCTAMYRKSDYKKVGGYKEYMKYGLEDFDFWLSLLELDVEVYRIDEILFNYRRAGETMMHDTCKHYDYLYKELVKHHTDLYLDNKEFLQRIFFPRLGFKREFKQLKKYRKLTKFLFLISIFELLFIIIKCFT